MAGFPTKAIAVDNFLLFPPLYIFTLLSMCFMKLRSAAKFNTIDVIRRFGMPRSKQYMVSVSLPVNSPIRASNCGQYPFNRYD